MRKGNTNLKLKKKKNPEKLVPSMVLCTWQWQMFKKSFWMNKAEALNLSSCCKHRHLQDVFNTIRSRSFHSNSPPVLAIPDLRVPFRSSPLLSALNYRHVCSLTEKLSDGNFHSTVATSWDDIFFHKENQINILFSPLRNVVETWKACNV